jgi:hypothetical protein
MKTSKVKTISKPKKTTTTGKAVKSKKVTPGKAAPDEKEIRKKAEEIYLRRIARGESGTATDDWHKAEEMLGGS